MKPMIAVKILVNHSPYTVGDIAGFDEAEAENLVKLGVGEIMGSKKPVEVKEEVVEVVEPETKQVEKAPVDKQIKKAKFHK